MGKATDQDQTRQVGDRLAPATTPDRATIRAERAGRDEPHADRPPTPEEEQAAEGAGPVDPEVAEAYEDAMRRGAAQEGEGKPGL